MNRKKYFGLALAGLSALWILFILTRSAKPAVDSAEESGQILVLVQRIVPQATDHLVRKLAHFTEFFVLGLLLGSAFSLLYRPMLLPPLLGCVLIAALDECIQLFYEGRSGEGKDVLLDSLGALCALLLLLLLLKKRCCPRKIPGSFP